jgi:hypothetical protein
MIKVINNTSLVYDITRIPHINQYRDITLYASETEDQLYIKVAFISGTEAFESYILEKTFDKNAIKGTLCDITFIRSTSYSPYNIFVIGRKFNRVDAPLRNPTNERIFSFATLYIANNGDVYIIPRWRLTHTSNKFDGCDYSEVAFNGRTPQEILFELVPETVDITKAWYIKKETLGDSIDTRTSVTYLENQVDVLYKIIEKLIAATNIDVSEYADILDAVDKTSVMNINSIEKIVNKINRDKKYIRTKQKEYHDKLKAAGFDA